MYVLPKYLLLSLMLSSSIIICYFKPTNGKTHLGPDNSRRQKHSWVEQYPVRKFVLKGIATLVSASGKYALLVELFPVYDN